jgi:hypothetical protein
MQAAACTGFSIATSTEGAPKANAGDRAGVYAHLFPNLGDDLACSTFHSKKSKLPAQACTLPPQTSQLKLPEWRLECCSLIAV